MEGAPKQTVVITGVSGFIGSQICKHFLENGQFKVRGTVRNTKKPEKIEPLKEAFGELFDQLELVEADLGKPESIHKACEGCTYVVHTASPFVLTDPKDHNEVIKPAVEGTLAAMKGAHMHKCKRLVLTSSVYAMDHKVNKKQVKFTPADWSDVKGGCKQAYEKSKTLAEKAAWDFLKKLPETERFELVVINPGFVMGPALVKGNFSSADFINNLLSGKVPKIPRIKFAMVDIRNVAKAHLNAVLKPEAANKRFILVDKSYWMKEIVVILKENFGDQFPKCPNPNKKASKMMTTIVSWFDKSLVPVSNSWGKNTVYVNDESKEILGIQFIPQSQTLVDMIPTLIKNG